MLIHHLIFLVDLLSSIVDTDYENWAVLVQCRNSAEKNTKFLSTRVISRRRSLSVDHFIEAQAAIERAGVGAPYKYPVAQDVCQELD